MTTSAYIALAYATGCVGIIGFQIALIVGAPWGRITHGGQRAGRLPLSGRIVAAVSIPIQAAMALSITSAADLWPDWPAWAGWTALAIQSVITVLNWITPSRPERRLWGPITLTMLVMAGLVVLSP